MKAFTPMPVVGVSDPLKATETNFRRLAIITNDMATDIAANIVATLHTYAINIGDGVSTSFVVTHNFGTRDVLARVQDSVTRAVVGATIEATSVNTLTVRFAVPPDENSRRIVIQALTQGFATDIGDGVATDFVIMHNLGTQDVLVRVRDTVTPFQYVAVAWEATSINAVTVRFAAPPGLNSRRVIVQS